MIIFAMSCYNSIGFALLRQVKISYGIIQSLCVLRLSMRHNSFDPQQINCRKICSSIKTL